MPTADLTRERQLAQSLREYGVPDHLRDGLIGHVVRGLPVGGFLTSLLSNDFGEAVVRAGADLDIADLRAIWKWLYNECPCGCFGTPERVEHWRAKGGEKGR